MTIGYYVVPDTGEGPVYAIIDAQDTGGSSPPVDTGQQAVPFEESAGVPIDNLRWDGTAVVAGAYVTQEAIDAGIKQEAIDAAQDELTAELAGYLDSLSGYFLDNFQDVQNDVDFINAATTIGDIKIALIGILDKYNLSLNDVVFLERYRTKYAAWIAAQNS